MTAFSATSEGMTTISGIVFKAATVVANGFMSQVPSMGRPLGSGHSPCS